MPGTHQSPQIIVIGAGVGGLTAAAALARAGLSVTVLEAHVYPGGCAGTFYHKGYKFDAGATLAGGFNPSGAMELVARATGVSDWPAQPAEPAMVVHLPGGEAVPRWGDDRRWQVYRSFFGPACLPFWEWQEQTADIMWSLALRLPPWPPQSLAQTARLLGAGLDWFASVPPAARQPGLLAGAVRSVAHYLPALTPSRRPGRTSLSSRSIAAEDGPEARLRTFVDAQLLISAQTTSDRANAWYGAAALDLPRRGVVHLAGGMGAVAHQLVQAIRDSGGVVLFRQQVTRILLQRGRAAAVETKRGAVFPADLIIADIPQSNIAQLLAPNSPVLINNPGKLPTDGWGAFIVYAGIAGTIVPDQFPLHHQIVLRQPLGEGNSVFLSISPAWDKGRAPAGKRAVTLSTHTTLAPWWQLAAFDRQEFEARKTAYTQRLLSAAECVLPGFQAAAELVLPGTPLTFERFTRRAGGWVGGYPQTNLLRAQGARLKPGLWQVGDSIFPGQSVAAVALGGLRVAADVLQSG